GSGTTRGPRSRPTKSTARQQSGDRRLFGAPPRTTGRREPNGLRHDARAPKSPDQKHSAAAVGRPAPVRGSASNYRETRTHRAQARRAGPEVARPKAQRGSSRATGACSGHGPEPHQRRVTDGISEAKPAPKSPDQKHSPTKSTARPKAQRPANLPESGPALPRTGYHSPTCSTGAVGRNLRSRDRPVNRDDIRPVLTVVQRIQALPTVNSRVFPTLHRFPQGLSTGGCREVSRRSFRGLERPGAPAAGRWTRPGRKPLPGACRVPRRRHRPEPGPG